MSNVSTTEMSEKRREADPGTADLLVLCWASGADAETPFGWKTLRDGWTPVRARAGAQQAEGRGLWCRPLKAVASTSRAATGQPSI